MTLAYDIDPESGFVGYLTWQEFSRLEWAVHNAIKHIPWWRVCGNISSRDADEARGKRTKKDAHPLPLPAPWLAAHEIKRLLLELNDWPELADAANDVEGVKLCRLLTREVETAVARWPISDRPHKVRYYRCQGCQQLTLRYFPPTTDPTPGEMVDVAWTRHGVRYSAEVRPSVVRCTDKTCRTVMGEAQWEIAILVIQQEHRDAEARRRAKR